MGIETITSFPSLFPVDLRQQRGKTIPLLGDFHGREGRGGDSTKAAPPAGWWCSSSLVV